MKGFEKILLQTGESRTVHVRLTQRSFAYYDISVHDFRTDAGQYTIWVGASSRDLRLSGEVELNDQTKPRSAAGLDVNFGREEQEKERKKAIALGQKNISIFLIRIKAKSDDINVPSSLVA